MNWQDYVVWTDKTAMPGQADSDACLRFGLIEEAHEVLTVWHTIQAIKSGIEKRKLRGDDDWAIELKRRNLEKEVKQLDSEIGDVLWYVARLCRVMEFGISRTPSRAFNDGRSDELALTLIVAHSIASTEQLAGLIAGKVLSLTSTPLETLLDMNVEKLERRLQEGTIKGSGER